MILIFFIYKKEVSIYFQLMIWFNLLWQISAQALLLICILIAPQKKQKQWWAEAQYTSDELVTQNTVLQK